MKKAITASLFFLTALSFNTYAQETTPGETYGKTLNLGLGIGGYSGYYGYVGRSVPVFHINYEFDVSRNFTLAPFISFSSYRSGYYWGDHNKNYPFKPVTFLN